MRRPVRFSVSVWFAGMLAFAAVSSMTSTIQAGDPRIEFELTDEPGAWFHNAAGPVAGFRSLAVATPGTEVRFTGKSNTVHTRTSLIFPTGAINMPFDTPPRKGSDEVMLHTPGLYVFTCKIHPYMFGAVIVDDPATPGLDLGEQISLVTFPSGVGVPTTSNLAARLLRTFFIATNPSNWLDYTTPGPWHITYPSVDVRAAGGVVVNLDTYLSTMVPGIQNDGPKAGLFKPSKNAVGEIWVDTQFEKTRGKSKPGTATAISGQTWQATRKVALPQINMNNPHNMWTDRNQNLIYQTQWFDSKLTVFNRTTGHFINNISVGESPSHVMTRVDTDQLHVALNGSTNSDSVVELAPLARNVERRINIGAGTPHAHWMGHDGKLMLTPNAFTANSTQYNFANNRIDAIRQTGNLPIATGMTPDSKKAYVASLLDSTITVIDTAAQLPIRTIDLLANYNAITGAISGPVGALPIQTPVSPNGKSMVTANTLTGTITIVDPVTDTVVAMLPCDPGCHGVQYGAKNDPVNGGYYAYVSSKFSNSLIIVDPDPDNDGNPSDATIAGRILLTATAATATDDTITGHRGMGGQGILTIPVVYNGWVQNLPDNWKKQLAPSHLNPIP
ncbi:MAG: copper oxidase [Nitrospira sp. SG-bin1]|nr:MAG: copper oxidase [Nitrospira sp. SG-bin1]